jgi:archaellum biogenesis protein FlaJ (TadC family)
VNPRLGHSVLLGIILLALVPGLVMGSTAHPTANSFTILPTSPTAGSTIASQTPTISASFSDNEGTVVPSSVFMTVNRINVTGFQNFTVTTSSVTYIVPAILKLHYGETTVNITATDSAGHTAFVSWGFNVNASAISNGVGGLNINFEQLVLDATIGSAVIAAGFGGYILYLKRTRKFTFHKYFATHPVNKEYLVLLLPLAVAFFVVLFGLTYVLRTPGLPLLSPEYVFIAGFFIAVTAYAIDSRFEKQRVRTFERAFAQFLFEMADAMRGGLDPAKALVELAGTHTNILRKPLRIAADGVQVGRPFDVVLKNMVVPMKSPLITRYAELIADASSVGGETAAVVHRAAKDLDEFIKIDLERRNALVLPVAVLYVAFGVLMAVLFALLSIEPSLGSVSLSLISGGANPLSKTASGATTVPKIAYSALEERFFDLMMINSIGTGVIIGAFTEGKPRYGLLHSLGLLIVTIVAFAIFA